jgi:hypothetical protein
MGHAAIVAVFGGTPPCEKSWRQPAKRRNEYGNQKMFAVRGD